MQTDPHAQAPARSAWRRLPLLLVLGGLVLVAGGFLYDVAFAGIPYQDPPPDVQARYLAASTFAAELRWAGLIVAGAGVVAWLARRFTARA